MSTPTKRAPASGKKAPVTTARKGAEEASKPFMRFHQTAALRTKTLEVLAVVECADSAGAHAGQLAGLVLELTDSGLDQYFVQPLKAAKASFVVQQSAALGLVGVQKVMGTVIRNVLGRMSDQQLLSVCGSIRQFMV